MVTLPSAARLPLLRKSLACYAAQTFADRELVAVLDPRGSADERAATRRAIAEIGRGATIVTPEAPISLGALRNLSTVHASGDIFCQWDDDDLQHPERLAVQYRAMRESGRCISYLQEVMILRSARQRLFWTNWAATPTGAHPATLMCDAGAMSRYPETGPLSRLSEDVTLLEALERERPIHRLPGQAHLYVYVTHGANTASPEHHAMLGERLAISRALLLRREAALRRDLGPIPFSRPVTVEGSNGPAFTLIEPDSEG